MIANENKPKNNNSDVYKLEEDNILFISGPYSGKRINEIWNIDATSKDYVYRQFYSCLDDRVLKILRKFLCQ